MGPVRTFRSVVGRVLTVGMTAVSAAALVSTLVVQGAPALLATGGLPVLAAVVVWALFWRPLLEVSDGGVLVVGVVKTTHVPWPCVTGVDRSWSLRVLTRDGPVEVWAVPVRGALGARAERRTGAAPGGPPANPGGADADAAAWEIEQRWDALADAGYLSAAVRGEVRPTVRWHVGTIATVVALVTWVWVGQVP